MRAGRDAQVREPIGGLEPEHPALIAALSTVDDQPGAGPSPDQKSIHGHDNSYPIRPTFLPEFGRVAAV